VTLATPPFRKKYSGLWLDFTWEHCNIIGSLYPLNSFRNISFLIPPLFYTFHPFLVLLFTFRILSWPRYIQALRLTSSPSSGQSAATYLSLPYLVITSCEQLLLANHSASSICSICEQLFRHIISKCLFACEQNSCRDVYFDNVWLAHPLRVIASLGIACERFSKWGRLATSWPYSS